MSQRGYALFFVLSLILLMSLLLTGVTRDSRRQAKAALATFERAQARADAETVLSLTVMRLLAARPEDRWTANGSARVLKLNETDWRVTITPEDGKVDINRAPAPLLAELFTAGGASPAEAQTLADRVIDWRDPDDITHTNGAERRAYEDAGLPPPRNGPFLKVQELKAVMGLTNELHACIADAVTVHSGKAGIDRRFGPALLRRNRVGTDRIQPASEPANSPLAIESPAGKVIEIRTYPDGGKPSVGIFTYIIRITEHARFPIWMLHSSANVGNPPGESKSCVSSVHRARPNGEIRTP